MITRKSLDGSVKEYRFVIQVSHDRSDWTFSLNLAASVFDAVIHVSYALVSCSKSQAFLAHGDIMKPRSWVPVTRAFLWRFAVHHLHAYLLLVRMIKIGITYIGS